MSQRLIDRVQEVSHPLEDDATLDPLLERIGDARIVLLGEASHGTHEYYTWRDSISRRLIAEKGFHFIAVEGDWPDCYRIDRWIRGAGEVGAGAHDVLHAFERWPTWMWANKEVLHLAEWMHGHNRGRTDSAKAGFFGLDVYSLWDSMASVIEYLDRVDPEAGRRARGSYACFDPYAEDVQDYAMATAIVPTSCEDEVVRTLVEMRRKAPEYREDSREGFFNAEQNALVARNAELYYRTMVRGGSASWNIRDTHMIETLARLLAHHGPRSKAIVWEHNTHVGDARYTDMARAGMVNVGQLAREEWGEDEVVIVGFSSHRGSVIAGREWGAPMQRMPVPEARGGTWEALFHDAFGGDRMVMVEALADDEEAMERRGHRAIGVVYDPRSEMYGNYVPTVMPRRYDVVLHVDRTHALHPLHMRPAEAHEPPETYPSGM